MVRGPDRLTRRAESGRSERISAEAERFRRFAARYETRRSMVVAVVRLVFGFMRMRKLATRPVYTPR